MFLDEQLTGSETSSYRQPRFGFGLAAARLWLVLALLISGGLSLDTGISAQRQLAHAEDAGTLPTTSTATLDDPAKAAPANSTRTSSSKPANLSAAVTEQRTKEAATPSANKSEPSFLAYSEPTSISLPSVGIQSTLITVGKTATGEMEVPEYPNFDKAAWYRESPTPGQYGASIILGHVDSYANSNGASVFYSLPKVKVGDPIAVTRADGSTVNFVVRALRTYTKTDMPNDIIYGPVTEDAELRLITCSGRFIHETGSYDSNTVVFATMKH